MPMRNAESDETDKIVDLRFAEALRIAVCVGAVIPGANSSNHFPPNAASSTVKPVMLPPGAAAILDIARKDEPLKEARNALRGIGAHDRLDVVGGAST